MTVAKISTLKAAPKTLEELEAVEEKIRQALLMGRLATGQLESVIGRTHTEITGNSDLYMISKEQSELTIFAAYKALDATREAYDAMRELLDADGAAKAA